MHSRYFVIENIFFKLYQFASKNSDKIIMNVNGESIFINPFFLQLYNSQQWS